MVLTIPKSTARPLDMPSIDFQDLPPIKSLLLEPTTTCNLRCVQCDVGSAGYAYRTLTYDRFEKLLPVLRAHKPVVQLNGNGESLGVKRFFDMLQAVIDAGCRVRFQTNGILMKPE